ncbi:MAG: hypothetical protein WDN28_04500 [Chthoniobacter sp.]
MEFNRTARLGELVAQGVHHERQGRGDLEERPGRKHGNDFPGNAGTAGEVLVGDPVTAPRDFEPALAVHFGERGADGAAADLQLLAQLPLAG